MYDYTSVTCQVPSAPVFVGSSEEGGNVARVGDLTLGNIPRHHGRLPHIGMQIDNEHRSTDISSVAFYVIASTEYGNMYYKRNGEEKRAPHNNFSVKDPAGYHTKQGGVGRSSRLGAFLFSSIRARRATLV